MREERIDPTEVNFKNKESKSEIYDRMHDLFTDQEMIFLQDALNTLYIEQQQQAGRPGFYNNEAMQHLSLLKEKIAGATNELMARDRQDKSNI